MPKKSRKSMSKRVKLKDKFKAIRKVSQHHAKERRVAKKLGAKKPSLLKDPGIPSSFPYREQFLKEMTFEKDRIDAKAVARKEALKVARAKKINPSDNDEEMHIDMASEMLGLQAAAAKQNSDFENRAAAGLASVSGDNDGSRKYFYKEFKKVVERSDVVMQVLDARDPMGCRCVDVERYIRSVNPNKKVVLILNKIDLVPKEVAQAWLKYLREELPTVAFKAATKKAGGIAHSQMPSGLSGAGTGKLAGAQELLNSQECLGADTLLQLLKNYTRNAGIKTAITVGVIGMPNVGKSSLINSLKRSKVAQVGNTPGVTKVLQEVHLDKQIRLLDSPGVVFASSESEAAAALRNCVKVEQLADPISPVTEILARVPAKKLMTIYKIPTFKGPDDMLQLIGQMRGKLKKGGTVDAAAAARIVLSDWNDGRIPFFTRPPTRGNEAFDKAELLDSYARDFDAASAYASEASAVVDGLPALEEGSFVEARAGAVATVDFATLDTQEAADAEEAAAMDESDQEDMMDDDTVPSRPAVTLAGQNTALYGEANQLNPKAVKAAKRKAKKSKGTASDDFDFDEY